MSHTRLLAGMLLLAVHLWIPTRAHAQEPPQAEPEQAGVEEQVAAALYDRGMVLFEQGDVANAKKMFSESLERSSEGSRSADALRMLRASNEKLGIGDLDSGRPAPDDGPLDPYANGEGEGPLNPYGAIDDAQPLDPYGADPGPLPEVRGPDVDSGPTSRRGLLLYGGLYGFVTGMTLFGPTDDADELKGSAVVAGLLGGAGGVYLSHWLSKRLSLTGAESAAISSAGVWGMYNFAHLANVFSGEDTDTNDIFQGLDWGGLVGTGLGYLYGTKYSPSEGDVALANSFSLYGTSAGLLLGVAMDPPRGDAYSLNAVLGSFAGIGTALYFADDIDTSRERMLRVDLGAAVGALVPWILIYPLSDSAPAAGFTSVLSMGAGGYLAWYLTDDDDEDDELPGGAPADFQPAAPALLRRSATGSWGSGAPILRPMNLPELAPRDGFSLGADVLSGRF